MKHYLIAHDLGTTGNKATLFDTDGSLLQSVTYHYPTHYFHGNWAEQNPLDWWDAFCHTTWALLKGRDASEVAAVSFSGQMMGCVTVDAAGKPLRPAIIWADLRSVEQADALMKQISPEEFYHIVGHRASSSYSLTKLMWIRDHEPDIFRQVHRTLQAKDYLVYRLTNRFVTDYSDASGTNALDLNKLQWSEPILSAAGLDPALFPTLCASTDVIGEVGLSASEACGLAVGTPIVLGAGDGVCASTGAASVEEGTAYNYLGSSSWIAFTSSAPVFDPQMRTFNWAHMVPGCFCPTGTMQAAGNSFNFVRDMLCDGLRLQAEADGRSVYDEINRLLESSPVGSKGLLFLPYLLGERSPRWNPDARGAYIGLTMEHSRADLLHAALEGILMNLAIILDVFRAERAFESIHLIGGMAQSNAICQMLADIFNVDAIRMAPLEEATSMGAAVCGGVGVGALEGFDAVHRFIRPQETLHPRPQQAAAYSPVKQLFEDAYHALEPLYTRLAQSRV